MDLVRDLLDNQLVDRNQQRIGRIDGIVLELRDGRPPRVLAMEVGFATAARRVHPRFGALVRKLAVRWLPVSMRPVRLSPRLFRDIGVDVEIDIDASTDRRLLRLEKWLRTHVVGRLPGGGE